MSHVSRANFGPLVAYLLPGATALWGLSPFSATLQSWFASAPADAPTVGGFLYLTAASLAAGMTVNAVRWAAIDRLHAATGLPMPRFDFSRLGPNVEAFRLLIEIHYAHYQFNANMFVALLAAYACSRARLGALSPGWLDAGFVALEAVFFATSRDTLAKYYQRGGQLLAARRSERRRDAVNRPEEFPSSPAPAPGVRRRLKASGPPPGRRSAAR